MVLDRLENASTYDGLSRGIAQALRYLRETDFSALAQGRYEIDGNRVVATLSEYDTKSRDASAWEAHRRYIDVQYVPAGVELMGRTALEAITAGPYDDGKDILFGEGEGDFFPLHGDRFVILFPQDAHMPGVAAGTSQRVRKVVIKVAVA
jgi:YhcH/YjgK/YiaL family protein